MKNGDMPAAPQDRDWKNDIEIAINNPSRGGFPSTDGIGLTKREHFAAMAMQGLLASCESSVVFQTHRDDGGRASIAELACRHADMLLEVLEREQ